MLSSPVQKYLDEWVNHSQASPKNKVFFLNILVENNLPSYFEVIEELSKAWENKSGVYQKTIKGSGTEEKIQERKEMREKIFPVDDILGLKTFLDTDKDAKSAYERFFLEPFSANNSSVVGTILPYVFQNMQQSDISFQKVRQEFSSASPSEVLIGIVIAVQLGLMGIMQQGTLFIVRDTDNFQYNAPQDTIRAIRTSLENTGLHL